jgi:uncharacterized protein YqjF (DUF2071 family)
MIIMTGRFPHIIQLAFAVEPSLLNAYLPPYTELDFFKGNSYISLVGLQPLDLKVYGIPVPWFRHQAQVNLRFYVRRRISRGTWRHGVVFIRQIIPHHLVAWGARLFFNEAIETQRLDPTIEEIGAEALQVQYSWKSEEQRHYVRTAFRQQPLYAAPADEQDFFVDRHWGYCRQRDGSCLEYRFDHPPWKTYTAFDVDTAAEVGNFYGSRFADILHRRPDFAYGSRGSDAYLTRGIRL